MLSGVLIIISLALAGSLVIKLRKTKAGTAASTAAPPASSASGSTARGFGEITKPEANTFSDTFNAASDPAIWNTITDSAGAGFSGLQYTRKLTGKIAITAEIRDMSSPAGGTGSAILQFCDAGRRRGFFVSITKEGDAYFALLSSMTGDQQGRKPEKKQLPGGENITVKLVRADGIASVYLGDGFPSEAYLTLDGAYMGPGFVRIGSSTRYNAASSFVSRFGRVSIEGTH